MAELPITRASLLARIRDARDQDAWRRFVQIYAPVVYGYAREQGLQDADAADLTQEVLYTVSAAAGRLNYDPKRGSFRSWLFTVAHHKVYDLLAQQRRQCRATGGVGGQELLEAQPARDEDRSLWEREYEQRLFNWAAEQVRDRFHDSTWQAFWQTAVEGKNGKEVAQRLGITVAAVYLAKSRVMAQLRQQIQQLEGD
jgi:RNA polymerase sigma-70 factor (ECF subfamily)